MDADEIHRPRNADARRQKHSPIRGKCVQCFEGTGMHGVLNLQQVLRTWAICLYI